ncbi:MAG: 30S ribosomal protein S18 [Candidatus Absconditabacterales bacterium]
MKIKKSPKLIVRMNDICWKNVSLLHFYNNRFGYIKPRKYTGNSVKFQKRIRNAVIVARQLGLLPFSK